MNYANARGGGEQAGGQEGAEGIFLDPQVSDHADVEVPLRRREAAYRLGGLVDDAGLPSVTGFQLLYTLLLQ